ncbi:MAG: nuclear transport factor 2 family protein [Actinomycetia bacterium]|nr:nuclear transport factor 2 family protein [Actinomycetes bacterium]
MDNIQLIRDYLGATVPGQIQLDKVREFLADDVKVDDPLMALEGADAFVAALASTQEAAPPGPEGAMSSTIQEVVGGDDIVAARVLFEVMGMTVQFSQWFWIVDGKISRIQVIYDPRPFLEMAPG